MSEDTPNIILPNPSDIVCYLRRAMMTITLRKPRNYLLEA